MDPLRPTPLALASHYSPAPIQPLAPSGAPGRIGKAEFPSALAPRSIDSAAMNQLARIASDEKHTEYGFVASTALAAFSRETLALSQTLGQDHQQAQYAIKVWNDKGKLLGRLAADVKQSGKNGYELVAAHFTRAGSSTPIGLTRDAHGVLQTVPGGAAPLPRASTGKRDVRLAAPKERAKAQRSWDLANRNYTFSNADRLEP